MDTLTRPEGTAPEDLRLTRRAAAGLLFAGYAVAALSAEAQPITTPADGLLIENAAIPNGAASPLPAFVARPAGATARLPTVIVISEIFGVHEYIRDVCRRLAKAGFVAVAPDFFYRSGVNLPALKEMADIRAVVDQATPDQVDGDVRAATDWLAKQGFVKADAIGITGFCWGGLVVWRSAMVSPALRAGVAWYGRLGTIIPRAKEIKAPVLGLYGGKDKGIPLSDVDAMRAALETAGVTGSSIQLYPDAEHGFHADYRPSYNPAAAADAWTRMLAHFHANGIG